MGFRLRKGVRYSLNARKKSVALVDLKYHKYIIISQDAFSKILNSNDIDNVKDYKELLKYLVDRNYVEYVEEDGEVNKSTVDYPIEPPEPSLRHVYWEITGRCNLACKTCFANALRSKYVKDIPLSEIFRIVDKLAPYKPSIQLSGGEPLLRKDIVDLVSYLTKKGIPRISILTNGTLLKEDLVYKLGEFDVSYQVSLDGATQETNDFIRGKGAYVRTIKGLEILKKAGVESVTVKMTPTWYNLHEMDELQKMVRESFGYRFAISLFEPSGKGIDLHSEVQIKNLLHGIYKIWVEKLNKVIEEVELKGDEILMDFIEHVSEQLTLNGYPLCSVGRRDGFMIDYKGDVYVCSSLRDSEFRLGNILHEDIPAVEFLRRWTPPSIDEFEKCQNCPVKYFCVGGGCLARNLAFSGSLTEPSPYCKLFGIIIEAVVWDRIHEQKNKNELLLTLNWMKKEFEKEAEKYEKE